MRIRQLGDPILREVSKPVSQEDIRSDEVRELIQHMKDVLNGIQAISSENGNALSAPQVGQLLRLILLRIDGVFYPMINPEFEALSDNKFAFEEECFSLYDQRATVQRYHDIKVTFTDEKGVIHELYLTGEQAGLVQHEIDHLDGILFLDRVEEGRLISIDSLLRNDPERLSQVREMICYMRS